MQQMNVCPYCGLPTAFGQNFCQACGVPLSGGFPPQQQDWASHQQPPPAWGQQQPMWAPPAPRGQSSPTRLLLVVVLIFLLCGIGGVIYWQFGSKSSSGTGQLKISNVVVRYKSQTSAQIIWTTNIPASSQVEYGRNPTYGLFAPQQPQDDPTKGASMGVIDHSVTLTGLRAGTLYYYRVKSKDAAGNEAVSPGTNFKTVPTIIQIEGMQPT